MPLVLLQRSDGGVSVANVVPTLDPEAALTRTIEKWEEGELISALQRPGYVARTVTSARVIEPGDLPASRRWRDAWRDNGAVYVNLVEARKIRRDELKAKRDRLLKEAAELGPLAEAAGAVTTAYLARKTAKDLQALDDAAIQASVDGVNDLASLETHEPAAIASAESSKVPTAQELAAALRTLAAAGIDGLDTLGRQLRAEAELTRKALNRIQARMDQLVAGIVANATYANLRAAANNLSALGEYTKIEVVQLFKDEIAADS